VTFSNAGRLGKWCFEAATCVGYAIKHGLQFSFPKHTNHPYHSPVYLTEYYNECYDRNLREVHLWEGVHSYEELPFEEDWRHKTNIIIEGYRQSEKYFKHCEDYIRKLFNPEWQLMYGYIGVHVRRGDYLTLPEKHPYIDENWYSKAMNNFEGSQFVFFSDDIAWCKEKFGRRWDCHFSEGRNEYEDLKLLSCCEHQIISSSTFGLWGYLLNRNEEKIGIIPQKWFVDGWGNLDTFDIVPPEIIKV
jgi:hypothetical protein